MWCENAHIFPPSMNWSGYLTVKPLQCSIQKHKRDANIFIVYPAAFFFSVVNVYCVNLAKLGLHFPEFSSLHSWLRSEEKFCLWFRRQEWSSSHILSVFSRLMLVWGVDAPHRCHRGFAGSSGWCGAAAWPTAPPDPTKSPGSTSLTPGPGPRFFVGERYQPILQVPCILELETCR